MMAPGGKQQKGEEEKVCSDDGGTGTGSSKPSEEVESPPDSADGPPGASDAQTTAQPLKTGRVKTPSQHLVAEIKTTSVDGATNSDGGAQAQGHDWVAEKIGVPNSKIRGRRDREKVGVKPPDVVARAVPGESSDVLVAKGASEVATVEEAQSVEPDHWPVGNHGRHGRAATLSKAEGSEGGTVSPRTNPTSDEITPDVQNVAGNDAPTEPCLPLDIEDHNPSSDEIVPGAQHVAGVDAAPEPCLPNSENSMMQVGAGLGDSERAEKPVTAYAVTDKDATQEAQELVRKMMDEAVVVEAEQIVGKVNDGQEGRRCWAFRTKKGRCILGALVLVAVILIALGAWGTFGSARTENDDEEEDIVGCDKGCILNSYTLECDDSSCWIQLRPDLVGLTAFDEFGEIVSLSGDGNRLAVSARLHGLHGLGGATERAGAVYIYDDDGSFSEAQVFYGEPGDEIRGYLSKDGRTVGIGAPFRDSISGDRDVGQAKFYRLAETGDWTPLGEPMEGEEAFDRLGQAIAISDDGSMVAVALPSHNKAGGSGKVRVYQYEGSGWVQVGSDVIGEDANDQFGWSVSLSADGLVLAVGARHNGASAPQAGHVRIYRLSSGGNWTQLGNDIDGEAEAIKFGVTCEVSADGMTVAVGSKYRGGADGTGSGRIRVFGYDEVENEWAPIGNAIDRKYESDRLGKVSLSANGRRLATGSVGGYVRVYDNIGDEWRQVGGTLISDRSADNFGMSVSLSENGTRLAVGSPSLTTDNNRTGYVRLYNLKPRSI